MFQEISDLIYLLRSSRYQSVPSGTGTFLTHHSKDITMNDRHEFFDDAIHDEYNGETIETLVERIRALDERVVALEDELLFSNASNAAFGGDLPF